MRLSRQFFLSTIEVFKNFSYNKVITLIQSLRLLYLIFNFDMNSLVINIAINVIGAVLLGRRKPALAFNIANVLQLFVAADPVKISVVINNTSFLFKFLFFSL